MTSDSGDVMRTVLDEAVDSRHDDVTGETWLHGRFTYVLWRSQIS